MGVPKFYRWISERYTKINEIVSDSALLPEFDHLYLDMNGIIHGCTHPSHMDICDVLSERDMMMGIMHYLDRIISQIVKPKVSLYMAIDGVAPRAKLNQQRSRRFRSAKDMAEATKDMDLTNPNSGENGALFDSNCITPGTEFMAKVSDTIKYFIRKKVKEDPLWRNLKIIFSGHEIPGEGEHKIMEHIRHMKAQPNYRPNTRHCIYGQDADLIMLGLVTHEPHFTILREVVDFGMGLRNKNTLKTVKKFTKESDFQLLHLSVLREYLQIEFSKINIEPATNPIPFDLERIIDDFVFMTFLVGNDFLPHLNTLDIGDGAFDLLFGLYKELRQNNWGGQYLTYCGEISDPGRLEQFLEAIGAVETETLEQREKDDAEYLKKKRRWNRRDGVPEGPTDAELKADEHDKQQDYLSMLQAVLMKQKAEGLAFVDGWKPVEMGEKDFKGRYYFEKMKLTPLDINEHMALRKAYMEGLMWCLAYYYKGCISWGWFYPYHYGPMLSDLRNLPQMFAEIKFEMGAPLTPFQQLMGCLPPASSALVPKPYRALMLSPQSPIIQFYPTDFKVDMNGKKNPWEGVNLLPFIDVQLLKDSIATHCPDTVLTPAERERNRKGQVYCYSFDLTCTGTVKSPNAKIGLTDIVNCHSQVTILEEPEMNGILFKPELISGTRIPYPGFPSLNVLPIASIELVPTGLNCFGMPSKYPNTILHLHRMPPIPPVEVLAENVLGKSLFVNWPMMHEGKVAAISDATCEVRRVKGKKVVKKFNQIETDRWATDSESMVEGYLKGKGVPGSGGVDIGEISLRLKILPLQGMKTNVTNGSTKKVFGKEEADVPLQLALWQAPAPDPRFIERGPLTLQDRFPPSCNVILTKGKYRGCTGTVIGVANEKQVGVKVSIMPPELPFGLALARTVYESYISSLDAARILKLPPSLFGKITGSLLCEPGKYDLGLNLKSSDGLCVAGYTRQRKDVNPDNKGKNGKGQKKAWAAGDSLLVIGSARAPSISGDDNSKDEKIIWEYTPQAIRLVNEYRMKFPQLFNALSRQPNERRYDAKDVFGPNGAEWLRVIREWLDKIETAKLPRTPLSTETMSREAVAAVERAAEVRVAALKQRGFPKESLIKIPGSALYRENSTGPTDILLASDYNNAEHPEIGDRIVNLCAAGIPFGARGTVIGVHRATTGCVEVVMDEEFMGGTTLQGACSNYRGKLCVWAHLLKISVENSKGLVDKLVPKGSGKAAVEKILSSIEKEVRQSKGKDAIEKSMVENEPVDTKSQQVVRDPVGQSRAAATPPMQYSAAVRSAPTPVARTGSAGRNRAGSAGKARPGSAGRGKQGAWREALGPAEKGVGFEAGRNVAKSGLVKWKELVASTQATANAPPNHGSTAKSAELKAMLGLSGGLAMAQPKPFIPQDVPSNDQIPSDAAAGLKALLGVGLSVQPPHPPPPVMDDDFPPPPPPPAPQPTAADKLLQLLSKQPEMHGPPMPGVSSFNFAYVEEGKEAPPPPNQPPALHQVPMPPPMGPMGPMGFPPPPPVQMHMPMAPYGYMGPHPPMHMHMPHPGMHAMHPPKPVPQQRLVPNQGAKPVAGASNNSGPSLQDFPPLGSSPPKLVNEGAASKESLPEKKMSGLMVPAVVATKGKK